MIQPGDTVKIYNTGLGEVVVTVEEIEEDENHRGELTFSYSYDNNSYWGYLDEAEKITK
jgi:hypothetical protein